MHICAYKARIYAYYENAYLCMFGFAYLCIVKGDDILCIFMDMILYAVPNIQEVLDPGSQTAGGSWRRCPSKRPVGIDNAHRVTGSAPGHRDSYQQNILCERPLVISTAARGQARKL